MTFPMAISTWTTPSERRLTKIRCDRPLTSAVEHASCEHDLRCEFDLCNIVCMLVFVRLENLKRAFSIRCK